jgi:aspartokinase
LGVLNLSAYAQQILSEVEAQTLKPVKPASIVVSLSRLAKQLQEQAPLKPQLKLEEITLKSGLCDITFEKTSQTLQDLKAFSQQSSSADQHFLAITQGVSEVTLIASTEYLSNILAAFTDKPKQIFPALVGMSIRFSAKYLNEPNVIYTILSLLAVKHINLLEIVSTYTELTVIMEQQDMYTALEVLKPYLISSIK